MSSAVTNGLDFALAGGYGYDYIGNGGNGRLDLLDKVSANAVITSYSIHYTKLYEKTLYVTL